MAVICYAFPMAIWHYMLRHSRAFCILLTEILRIRRMNYHQWLQERRTINALTICIISFPVFLSLVMCVDTVFHKKEEYVRFWFLDHTMTSNQYIEGLAIFVCMAVYFSMKFTVPSLAVLFHSILCYRLATAIRIHSDMMERNAFTDAFTKEIRTYQLITRCCAKFADCSKATMFLMITLYFVSMYTGIALALGEITIMSELAAVIESVITIAACIIFLVFLILSASYVPEAMEETASKFQNLYTEVLLIRDKKPRLLLLLRAVSEMKPVFLTVYGLLKVDKSLILKSFGCAFTYCLLIMQLKRFEI